MSNSNLYPELIAYLETIESEFGDIPSERLPALKQISQYIHQSLKETGFADLVFICTHNSRRSQFGQIWGAIGAEFYGIEGIGSHSGGTESTAIYPRVLSSLERAGLQVERSSQDDRNHKYLVRSREESPGTTMFSKIYDDPANPSGHFCAIMVCSDADEACPHVAGARERISLPYDDPKSFDGTGQEKMKYDERCREIARDILYVFSLSR